MDLRRPQRGARVRGEERVARARAEDDHASFLQVSDGAAPDVRLGHLRHAERGHHPRRHAVGLHGGLKRDGVHDRGEHAHVVRGRAIKPFTLVRGAAEEVPAADDDRHLHARERRLGYLTGDLVHHVSVDAEAPLPRECLAANLEHHPRPLLVRAGVAGAIELLVLARANGYRARARTRSSIAPATPARTRSGRG